MQPNNNIWTASSISLSGFAFFLDATTSISVDKTRAGNAITLTVSCHGIQVPEVSFYKQIPEILQVFFHFFIVSVSKYFPWKECVTHFNLIYGRWHLTLLLL